MRLIHLQRRGAALLCLTLSLTACAGKELVRTETVEVKVPVLVALDPALTTVEPEPDLPAGAVTNDDVGNLIDALRAWGRGLAGKLTQIADLQPSPDGGP